MLKKLLNLYWSIPFGIWLWMKLQVSKKHTSFLFKWITYIFFYTTVSIFFADIIGICNDISNDSFTKKDGSGTFEKKTITLCDSNNAHIKVQLFEGNFDAIDGCKVGSVVAFTNMNLSAYKDEKYLLFTSNSRLELEPNHECIPKLKELFEHNSKASCIEVVDFKTAMEKTKPFEFASKIKIVDIDVSNVYKCCPSELCEKKVFEQNNGSYNCQKCNKTYTCCTIHALFKVTTKLFLILIHYFINNFPW